MPSHIESQPPQLLWDRLYKEGLKRLRARSLYGRILLGLIVVVELALPSVIFLTTFIFFLQEERRARLHLVYQSMLGGAGNPYLTDEARIQASVVLVVLLLFWASKALVILIVVISGWADLASFRKAVRSKSLVMVSENDEPRLHGLARKVATAVGIDTARLRIWLSFSPTSLPSVVDDRSINLLAPMGFVNMAEDDPQSCEAILAHEFAHILHRDTRLWRRLHAVSRAIYHVSVPITLFILITAPIRLNAVILPMADQFFKRATQAPAELFDSGRVSLPVLIALSLFLVIPILLEYSMYRWLVRSRLLSEDLADLFAVIRTSPSYLAQAIRSYVGPTIDQMHRPKESRIKRIEALSRLENQTTINELPRDPGTRRIVVLIITTSLSYVLLLVLLNLLRK